MTMIRELKAEAVVPTILKDTKTNLSAVIHGENHEYKKMYPGFADIADSEGLSQVAYRLRAIATAEENHEDRFKVFLKGRNKISIDIFSVNKPFDFS